MSTPRPRKGRNHHNGNNGRGSGRTARLRSREDIQSANPLAAAALHLIEQAIPAEALDEGHRYARQGQVAKGLRQAFEGCAASPLVRFGPHRQPGAGKSVDGECPTTHLAFAGYCLYHRR